MAYEEDDWDDEHYGSHARNEPSRSRDHQDNAKDALKKGMDESFREMRDIEAAQARGEHVAPYKLLGLSMPASVGVPLRGMLNYGQGWLGKKAQMGVHHLVETMVVPHVADPTRRNLLLQSTALATGIGVVLSDDVVAVYKGFTHYKKDLTAAALKIAPVLDEIKGGHGFISAQRVTLEDNEVFYTHKQRLSQKFKLEGTKAAIGAGGKATAIFDQFGDNIKRIGIKLPEKLADNPDSGRFMDMATVGLGGFSEHYKTTLEAQHVRATAKPDAFTLITELAEQIKGNPDIDGFEIKGVGRQLPLRDYIAFTFRCHQEEMARLHPEEYTTIRSSLSEPLMKASEMIATGIREGRIDPLMLVRLVGERQIVKNCGRAVAPEKDVESILRHMSGKAADYVKLTKADVLKDVSEKDYKATAEVLQGDQRKLYMAALPEDVLVGMGFAKREVKAAHEAIDPTRAKSFAPLVVGLANEGEKALSAIGQDKATIAQLEKARDDVLENGPDAVSKYLTSSVNPDGLEQAVISAVVEKNLDGDRTYMGTLQARGHQALASNKEDLARMAAQGRQELDAEEEERPTRKGRHSDRVAHARVQDEGAERSFD